MRNAKTLTTIRWFFYIIDNDMEKQKVIVYVDGFNFYYGLKAISQKDKRWKKFYWLNMVDFFSKMLTDNQELVEVNFFPLVFIILMQPKGKIYFSVQIN